VRAASLAGGFRKSEHGRWQADGELEQNSLSLTKYRDKRDFKATPEPKGASQPEPSAKDLSFVVQKHQASHLHYDFRLEWNGVLLSWAVPKGPSLDPSVKRLAMPVEDHPLEYGGFEGVIPEGQYGGGTVMVWDRGYWVPDDKDVDRALREGQLKFSLFGAKLRGSWALVRTVIGGSPRIKWLLIKHRDGYASAKDIVAEKSRSAVSKKLLAEIAKANGGDVLKASKGDPQKQTRS
jgi:bifunctional non-homologous end joining protein LigD